VAPSLLLLEPSMSKKTVLVVDDEPDMLDCVAEVLAEHFELSLARDGAEALQKLRKTSFDGVVLDLKMDCEPDGFDVLRYLAQQQPQARVLIASGLPSLDRIAKQYGASDWLAKPYHIEALEEHVARLLGEGHGPS
jgi:DNA-binding NtrC family response regulator